MDDIINCMNGDLPAKKTTLRGIKIANKKLRRVFYDWFSVKRRETNISALTIKYCNELGWDDIYDKGIKQDALFIVNKVQHELQGF